MTEPRKCARCKKTSKIVGRNLCSSCYKKLKKDNQLDLFPIRRGNEHFQDIRVNADGNKVKQCTMCDEWKLLSCFGKNPQSSVGFRSWCKDCQAQKSKEYYLPKKETIKRIKESVYCDGLKKCKKCEEYKSLDCYTTHSSHWDKLSHICRQCANKQTKVNQDKNKEIHSLRSREWYLKNKDRKYQKYIEWRKLNLEKARAIWHRYKSNKLNADGNFTSEQWKLLVEYYCPTGLCLDCGKKKKLTFDHVVPLSKGGSNYINNIQPLCGNCNSKKSNHNSMDFRPDNGEFARSLLHAY